jgi:hypothetical protein
MLIAIGMFGLLSMTMIGFVLTAEIMAFVTVKDNRKR